MFKKALAQFSLLLLLGVLISPTCKAYAQSASSAAHPTVITGTDPEPPGEPDVITGTDPEPPGEPDVITGTDPEPPGEPDSFLAYTLLAFELS